MSRAARVAAAVVALAAPALASCQADGGPSAQDVASHKVLLLAEENSDPEQVLRPGAAPYLQGLLDQGANLTGMEAGYPAECPSLPGYLLLTSGSTHGICDDHGPDDHPVDGPSIFAQVAESEREWRVFAQSMEEPCQRGNSDDDRYLVRHTGAPYYTSEEQRCEDWQVPLGTPDAGSLKDAVETGLPAFSLVVPDKCNDMHGGDGCTGDRVAVGDAWLEEWMPAILASPDYTSGNLLVIITWDESDDHRANQIPTLVLHPSLAGTTVDDPRDHCSTLRSMSDWLGLDPLGCAAEAEPLVEVGGG